VMSPKDEILNLLVERNLNKRISLLANLLNNYSTSEINDALRVLDREKIERMEKITDIKLRFNVLKTICDGDDKNASKKSMELMKNQIDDCLKIDSIEDRVHILKYIAIHSDKETFKKAVGMLGDLIDEMVEIKNMELRASTLRYLAINGNKEIRKKAVLQLKKIPDKDIKKTSLEYVEKMQKYD